MLAADRKVLAANLVESVSRMKVVRVQRKTGASERNFEKLKRKRTSRRESLHTHKLKGNFSGVFQPGVYIVCLCSWQVVPRGMQDSRSTILLSPVLPRDHSLFFLSFSLFLVFSSCYFEFRTSVWLSPTSFSFLFFLLSLLFLRTYMLVCNILTTQQPRVNGY